MTVIFYVVLRLRVDTRGLGGLGFRSLVVQGLGLCLEMSVFKVKQGFCSTQENPKPGYSSTRFKGLGFRAVSLSWFSGSRGYE